MKHAIDVTISLCFSSLVNFEKSVSMLMPLRKIMWAKFLSMEWLKFLNRYSNLSLGIEIFELI